VEDHTHRDDIGSGQRIPEEIAGSGADAVTEPGGSAMCFWAIGSTGGGSKEVQCR